MCVVRESPDTQHWHPTSIATGAQLTREELRLLTFYDLATTVCAMSSLHWPCNTSWEHSMSHNIYYMSHIINKWNLYCSYTIKYIFVGIGIPRDLTALKKKKKKQKKNSHHSATFSAGCWREPRMLICLALNASQANGYENHNQDKWDILQSVFWELWVFAKHSFIFLNRDYIVWIFIYQYICTFIGKYT